MKLSSLKSLVGLLALGGAPALAAAAVESTAPVAQSPESAPLTATQLDQLLAPVALYPDPLIAILLPAATFPADLVLAARFLAAGGSPDSFEAQPWDDSVKALARYPELLKWMDQNLDWTRRVGAAFLAQPAEVLTATQRLRAAARAAGHLTDTAQQTVVVERETIRILPARPDLVYLPIYDYHAVYRPRVVHVYHSGPAIRFSSAYRAGPWLAYQCDWGHRAVVVLRPTSRHVAAPPTPRRVSQDPSAPPLRPAPPSAHRALRVENEPGLPMPPRGQRIQETRRPRNLAPPPRAVTEPAPAVTRLPPAVTSPAPAIPRATTSRRDHSSLRSRAGNEPAHYFGRPSAPTAAPAETENGSTSSRRRP